MESQICQVHLLGLVEYQQAWELQERLAREIAAGARPPTLLLLEHPHTFTFGRGGHAENLLWEQAELEQRGVSLYWVDRGGDVTYHGPGQLVGYPLLPLAPGGIRPDSPGGLQPDTPGGLKPDPANVSTRIPQADYVGYVRRLEQTLILALAGLGVASQQVAGLTGVWAQLGNDLAKVAAIGVKVDAASVSHHGFALNVNPDMSYWQGIVGCGLEGYAVTSLAELLGDAPAMEAVIEAVMLAFGNVYHYELVAVDLGASNPAVTMDPKHITGLV
jgi:lipoate-protein ligase B